MTRITATGGRSWRWLVLCAGLVLGTPAPAAAQPASPPAGPIQLGPCIAAETTAPGEDLGPGGDLAPEGPPREGVPIAPNSMVRAALDCAQLFANQTMTPIGVNLLRALSVIIVIWTGVQMMISRRWDMGEVVSLIFLLGFPWAVLSWYNATVNTPWGAMSFVTMVSGMGRVVGQALVEGRFEDMAEQVTAVSNMVNGAAVVDQVRTLGTPVSGIPVDPRTIQTGSPGVSGFFGFFRALVFNAWAFVLLLILLLPMVVAYCSYLWAYVSLAVATILGPLLIPWVVVPQMQFLAWGWFRSVLGAGVHMMVAGACFVVCSQLLLIPIARLGFVVARDADRQGAVSQDSVLGVIVESAPLIIIACLGAFKIGEITSMIMNGGAMPVSGLGERVASMQKLGMGGGGLRSAATAGAAVATGGKAAAAAAAAKVLSQKK